MWRAVSYTTAGVWRVLWPVGSFDVPLSKVSESGKLFVSGKEVNRVVEKKQHVSTISVDEVADPHAEALEKALKVSSLLIWRVRVPASTEDLTRIAKALDRMLRCWTRTQL